MKFVLYFAIGWCVLLAVAGEALAYDGNDLLEYCQKFLAEADRVEDLANRGVCLGYVAGVVHTDQLWRIYLSSIFPELQTSDRSLYCLPGEPESIPSWKQLVRVVVKYLEDNPAELHRIAAPLVQRALIEAFPCPEGGKQ